MAPEMQLNFDEGSRIALDVCVGLVMLSVAFDLKPADFYKVFSRPKAPLIGLMSHYIVLPCITLALIWILRPRMGFALGMLLVASCPGGNIANFYALIGKGNIALSVSLTAISEGCSFFMLPLVFFFYSHFLPGVQGLPAELHLEPGIIIGTVFMVIGVPLVLGMTLNHYFPKLVDKVRKPSKFLSMFILIAFIVGAIMANKEAFIEHIPTVLPIVALHNAVALISGYLFGKLWRLPEPDCRTVSVETGIQNSGLGLVIILNFFNGYGEMAIITAVWGVWHIIGGATAAFIWSRFPPEAEPALVIQEETTPADR
jgi:BASS family bile acid:Na+ symporter